jgi:hypothetical protein
MSLLRMISHLHVIDLKRPNYSAGFTITFLRLAKECHSISYDAMVAWNAIVFARYMMLAFENRIQRDERAARTLFYTACNELSDITWIEGGFRLLLKTFLDIIADKYLLEDMKSNPCSKHLSPHSPLHYEINCSSACDICLFMSAHY